MEFDISTLMITFFILAFVISIWKIYAFFPNKQLKDDDKTQESHEELTKLVLHVIKSNSAELSLDVLFKKILCDERFDERHYWRFNKNRLNQLLDNYYLKNPHAKSIADIYENSK
ncbi:hypothetical protein HUE87_02405 [Candidatus Sulfurimonas marisnigri]|uniref:Uncharacterized protein n=1 Tax=Candidatus Sulfurimonas marisnigri TaxID=2740405 RepID=A0A7S7M240_9BACT|nr:hypothetical protein [Candidatus Sulfurimonas marisnigri]QOY55113.1 hypothetical protein HUE87_02405 [Candidatus Sulfurimonas marisnigri]